MSKGYVYILSNECMPGLVKIGRTVRDVDGRARELYQTGVPTPFKVEHSVLSPDCFELERMMHEELVAGRLSTSREFFKCSPNRAIEALEGAHYQQMYEWTEEFLPDHFLIPTDICVGPAEIHILAKALGEPEPVIADALAQVSADELKPALARVYARTAQAKARREASKA